MKFSIISITYQNIAGLTETSESVLSQTYPDYQWIVIDGGSSDGTVEFLRSKTDPRLTWVSEKDNGIFDAMNKGIERAQGTYCIFMNAGDRFYSPDVLANVAALIGVNRPDCIYGDSIESSDAESFLKRARSPRWNAYSMFTHHQAIFYRTNLSTLRYDLSYRFSADWAMTTRILSAKGVSSEKYPGPVCIFERGGVSQRDDFRAIINREHWRILRNEAQLPLPIAATLYLTKTSSNRLRKLLPNVYDFLRFGNASR